MMLNLDGHEYFIQWKYCKCNSYPIAVLYSCGRCKACGSTMSDTGYETREKSEEARRRLYEL